MKNYVILGSLLFCASLISAQNSFELLISNNHDQIISDVKETSDSSFVMIGSHEPANSQGTYNGVLIKISKLGIVEQIQILDTFDVCYLQNIHILNKYTT